MGGTQFDLGGLLFELPEAPFVPLAEANLEASPLSVLGREAEVETGSPSVETGSSSEVSRRLVFTSWPFDVL